MEDKPLLERLLDPEQIQAWLALALDWVMTEVLVIATLVQVLVVLVCWIIAKATAPKLRSLIESQRNKTRFAKYTNPVINAFAPLVFSLVWLLGLWFSVLAASQGDWPNHVMESMVGLLTAWVVIRLMTGVVRNPALARTIAVVAWGLAALNLLGLLAPVMATLDSMGISFGGVRITVLGAIQAGLVLGVLLWASGFLAKLVENKLEQFDSLSPSARVLIGKTVRILLIVIAVVVALNSIGIDLTALAVFSGALGLGIGFGLQTVVSNLISGLILLMDKSVKPGDVIAIGNTFGWINSLKARHVSVITRDGTEHLIPNEELISQRVENWSYSDTLVRMKIPIGISYDSDPRQAMELAVKAAETVERVEKSPAPVCRFVNLGGDAVELELRVWISDPQRGMVNVRSEVLLNVWDLFQENGVEFPYGQRDLHIRSSVPIPVEVTAQPKAVD